MAVYNALGMDKNNDIQVNKVNKWDYGVVDMSLWHLKDEFDALVDKLNGVYGIDVFEIEELTADTRSSMDKVHDRFNELEVERQKESGMISQYEEENKNLKSELDIKTDECDALISRVFKQDEEYTKLEAENEELRTKCMFKEDVLGKMNQEVAELEKEKLDLENQLAQQKQEACVMISRYEEENRSLRDQRKKLKNAHIKLTGDNDYLRKECDRHIDLLDKLRWALEDEGIYCEWSEAALKWNLRDTANICESCKQHFEEELRIRYKEIDSKNELIDELNQKIEELESKNKSLDFKFHTYKTFSYVGHTRSLKDKIRTLEKENKDLKDLLEKNEDFGKYVGERVADSIREGHDKGIYKLHPLTRIDIHVEKIKDVPLTFARYSIPRISVMFNNTQTEMERDTAQHECEELNEKTERLWRVNDELNRKIKELEKENKDLKEILAFCERDANMVRSLSHNIAFNAERARNKTSYVKAGIRL